MPISDVIEDILRRLSCNETLENYEARLRRKDGSLRDVVINSNVLWENGEFVHSRCFTRDITALKQAERALTERARQAELTAHVAAALTSADTLQVKLQRCAEALVHFEDAAFARIWMLNEATAVLELQASAGLYTHLDGAHGRIRVGAYKIGLIAAERRPHVTNAVADDPLISDPSWAKCEGMIAFAGYPLIVGDRLVGVMALFARHTLSDAITRVLESVADGIALGIDQARAEHERGEAPAPGTSGAGPGRDRARSPSGSVHAGTSFGVCFAGAGPYLRVDESALPAACRWA